MNTATKQYQKKPGTPEKFKNNKPQNSLNNEVRGNENLPPYAFLIMDLTDLSRHAKIIRITQLLLHKDGETELTQHLFNNEDVEISDVAAKYHGITAEQLKGKPSISTFNFFAAQNIIVWDGKVSGQLLGVNGVKKTAPIINLQSLARYTEPDARPISLYNYAKKEITAKRHVLEFLMQKNENKATILRFAFDHIQTLYLKSHGVNSADLLEAVGLCETKKESINCINKYLSEKQLSKAKHSTDTGNPGSTPKRKIIVVKK